MFALIKLISKWLLYFNTIFIMIACFNFYYNIQDKSDKVDEKADKFVFPYVVMSLVWILVIWVHFLYHNRQVMILVMFYGILMIGYRPLLHLPFSVFNMAPSVIEVILAIVWIIAEMICPEIRELTLQEKIAGSADPFKSPSPSELSVNSSKRQRSRHNLKKSSRGGSSSSSNSSIVSSSRSDMV